MEWQEYQDAVAVLYEQIDDFGTVHRNVYLPDKVTGQKRQIDVLIELIAKGHTIRIVVDAKFHSEPIDVTDVDAVLALAEAVGAQKAVVVAANGWTAPAMKKATFSSCDLRLLELEEALDLMVPDKWEMCSACARDCIVLDDDGAMIVDGLWFWWLAGQCRSCKHGFAWCQECGSYLEIDAGTTVHCTCKHAWSNSADGISVELNAEDRSQ